MFDNQSVLVTGGTGSFGKKCIQAILDNYKPRRIIVFSRDELKQSVLQERWPESKYPMLRYFLGDVRDPDRLADAFHGVDIVIHAAALKQVPALEYNPFEAIKTNVHGAQNIIRASINAGVKKVVALSTDKAANPLNLYGASKLCSDKLFIAGNNMAGSRNTRFAVVRYGNVFGSRGSVVPFFIGKRQTGVLPITDLRMTRFNITLSEAVDFVFASLERMHGGELFIPKIPSYKIADVATAVGPECVQKVVGIRPGEKIHEIMIAEDDARNTMEFDTYYVIMPAMTWWMHTPKLLETGGKPCAPNFVFHSGNNKSWNTVEDLAALVDDVAATYGLENKPATDAVVSELKPKVPVGELAIDGGEPVRSKMLPYGRQAVDEEDISKVVAALRGDWLTTGPAVSAFEEAVAEFTGAKYAVALSSGTAALHASVFAANLGSGDEVIVPSLTFVASANAVVYQGATPVFADVEPDTLNIDVKSVEKLITPRTKAIVAVDYGGQPANYEALRVLADKFGLIIIEDASHSIGACHHGAPVGTLNELTTFSFHPVKHITTCEGGMVVTNNEKLADRMRVFRNHGITTDHRQRAASGGHAYEMTELGYNYRLSDVQCALGISQLAKLPGFVSQRIVIASQYNQAFRSTDAVNALAVRSAIESSFHLYVVRLDLSKLTVDRDTIFKALRAENIGVNVHYPPLHLHPYYVRDHKTKASMCPVAEAAYKDMLSLPMFPTMTEGDVKDVIDAVLKVTSKYSK